MPDRIVRRLLTTPGVLIPAVILVLLAVVAIFPGAVAGLFGHGDPFVCQLGDSAASASPGHPFGRDVQGCDLYANVVYGTRTSLTIGLLTTLMASVVAIVFGTIAGLYGGILDIVISRVTDVFLGFPFLLGAIILLSAFPTRTIWSVSVALAVFAWPLMARLVRTGVRSVKSAEYVLAARAMGLGEFRLVMRYILANSLSPLLVVGTIMVGSVIVAESSLTYLGIGLQAPAISWGLQLASAQPEFQAHPHLLVFPALFLAVTVLSIILLGDGLRQTLDPKRGRR
ncbi:MAG: Peptide transporter permease [Frondihabitans sp.]|nr:Peptide transporter permease [Frondihabitans sp.]